MTTIDQDQSFSEFKSGLKEHFGPDVYNSYFEALRLGVWEDDLVVLLAKNGFAADLISERFSAPVRTVWNRTCGHVSTLEVAGSPEKITSFLTKMRPAKTAGLPPIPSSLTKPSPFDGGDRAVPVRRSVEAPALRREFDADEAADRVQEPFGKANLNGSKTLERFCVNGTNQLARHAVTRLLDGSGSPITYIYGASGRGKSHLLNATAVEWLRRYPSSRVMYLHYDSLVADVSDACMSNGVKELKEYLQDTDVLVFDDVHLLRGRKRTQEELACLIDRLHQVGKPVLVAGAMSPGELAHTGISQRLADRLSGGLSVGVESPDLELRLRVVNQIAQAFTDRTGREFPQRHLDLIARRCDTSIREIEGVMHLFELALDPPEGNSQPLTDERARQMLNDKLASRRQTASLDEIFAFVIDLFGVSRTDMTSKSRRQPIVRARQAFCLAGRKLTDSPLAAIGAMICRDHTTVMHSVSKAEIIAETDPAFADRITRIFDDFERS